MKKLSKVVICLIILVIIQLVNVNNVSSAYNNTKLGFEFSVVPNRVKVKPGEEVKVQMLISEINVGDIRYQCNTRRIKIR